MITDLSFPEGASVNDGKDPQLCSLQYTSVERVACAAQSLGKGAHVCIGVKFNMSVILLLHTGTHLCASLRKC